MTATSPICVDRNEQPHWSRRLMPRFHEPDLGADPNSPFARDASGKLVRRSYWLDMTDGSLVMVTVNGIGAHRQTTKREHI